MPRAIKKKYSAQADGEDIEVTDDEAGANAVESSDPPAKAAPILEGVARVLIEGPPSDCAASGNMLRQALSSSGTDPDAEAAPIRADNTCAASSSQTDPDAEAAPICADNTCAASGFVLKQAYSGTIGVDLSSSESEAEGAVASSDPPAKSAKVTQKRTLPAIEEDDGDDVDSDALEQLCNNTAPPRLKEKDEEGGKEDGGGEAKKGGGDDDDDDGGDDGDDDESPFDSAEPPASFITPESVIGVAIVRTATSLADLPTMDEMKGLTNCRNVLLGVVGEEAATDVYKKYGVLSEMFMVKVYALHPDLSDVQLMNIMVSLGCEHGFDLVEFFRFGITHCVPADISVFSQFMTDMDSSLIVRCTDDSIVTWAWFWAAGVAEGNPHMAEGNPHNTKDEGRALLNPTALYFYGLVVSKSLLHKFDFASCFPLCFVDCSGRLGIIRRSVLDELGSG